MFLSGCILLTVILMMTKARQMAWKSPLTPLLYDDDAFLDGALGSGGTAEQREERAMMTFGILHRRDEACENGKS